jgi:long-chain acyl-CoA synthetase
MDPTTPVDEWRPPWSSFRDVFAEGADDVDYLTELDHDQGSRRQWTRGQWRERVTGVAVGLADHGIRAGDKVAMLSGNSADALAVAFACWVTGACYLPLNAHETTERQAYILRHADARLLVHTPSTGEAVAALARETGIPALPAEGLSSDAPALPDDTADLDLPALRVYTSGTTGEPKGVELTIANLMTNCHAMSQPLGWAGDTRVLVVLPVHHVNGLVLSSLTSWFCGSSAVLCDRFRSDRFWRDAADEGATVCSMVPTLLEFLLSEGDAAVPTGFREVLCGAGPLMSDTVLDFERTFGVPVRHLYGLSETTAIATLMPQLPDDQRRRWYVDHGFPSIGVAVPHVEVQVHDLDGRPCAEGERGELVIRGAAVMNGYAGRPDATAEAFRNGWFHSGDEGFWRSDAGGLHFFFITGRMKELIIRGGVNISPFQVDEVLRAHPAVKFGLAIPFENRYYGEEIAAYVVPCDRTRDPRLLR